MPLAISAGLDATLGLVGVFFVAFPLLVNGLVVYIAAQVIGERAQNQAYERADTTSSV